MREHGRNHGRGLAPALVPSSLLLLLLATSCASPGADLATDLPRPDGASPDQPLAAADAGPAAPDLPTVELALARCPSWLRPALVTQMTQLRQATDDERVERVLSTLARATDRRTFDEIAFVLAHYPLVLLTDDTFYRYFHPELLIENAEQIYAMDPLLAYIELLERGDDRAGGDWHTTAAYRSAAPQSGDFVLDLALDREAYYWWIVFPTVLVEPAAYVSGAVAPTAEVIARRQRLGWPTPASASSFTYQGLPVPPDQGLFWRNTFPGRQGASCPFATEAAGDDGPCPALLDLLAQQDVLWSGEINVLAGNGAVGAVATWIRAHLWFNANSPRSEYPSVILENRSGRCGEFANATAAAARAALIPTRVAFAYGNDHAWNEFFDGKRWVQLEPAIPAVDDPSRYDGTLGDKQGLRVVNALRGDMLWIDDTATYTPAATLRVTATGKDGLPLPQVLVEVFSGWPLASRGWTGPDGTVTFGIGDGLPYSVQASHAGATVPPFLPHLLIPGGAVPGQTYTWTAAFP